MKSLWLGCTAVVIFLLPAIAAAEPCTRVDRLGLSSVAAEVLSAIETNPDAMEHSPVPKDKLLSTCNKFESVLIDGPNIFGGAKELISRADREVDIVMFGWEADSLAARLIGEGIIAAQQRRTTADRLLVRIIVDEVDLHYVNQIDELQRSKNDWIYLGLDTSRVTLQFGTAHRATPAAAPLHEKIIIVDGRYLWTGGANVQKYNDPGRWHDSAYIFDGDGAQSALAVMDEVWTHWRTIHWICPDSAVDCSIRLGHYDRPSRPWLSPFGSERPGDIPILAVGRTKEQVLFSSHENPQDIAWQKLMRRASSHINVESPNINAEPFRAEVLAAVRRGVTVRLITSMGFNDFEIDLAGGDNLEVAASLRQALKSESLDVQQRLQFRWTSRDGIEPAIEKNAGASHTKYMTTDGTLAMVGSGNQDDPSWNNSHEFNVLIDDPRTTATLDDALFNPDWSRAITTYLEFYEGNRGEQDGVCVLAATRDKGHAFSDPIDGFDYKCNNDEARSLLLHDIPAGKVFRLYDDREGDYQDDDWTEILVKRPVARKYVDTFEQSFEDDDIRVIHHRDNGLDGKVSYAHVASAPFGAVVDLYEGNSATQNLVCSNRITGTQSLNFKSHPHCDNDEARSLVLYDFPADRVIILYDDPSGSRSDDYAIIVPKRRIAQATVTSFESSYETADFKLCAFYRNGLDGKVSRMRIGFASEAASLCTVPPPTTPSTGSPYTLSPSPATQYPDSGGELTNGVTATGESWLNAAGWINTNPMVTLDLGQMRTVSEVEIYAGNSFGTGQFGVSRPANVAVSLSTDGVTFTSAGSLTFVAFSHIGTKEQVDRGTLALTAPARYVRYSITAGGPWVMVTEVVVNGTTAPSCPNVGQPCDGADGDSCAEGTVQADCSCSDNTPTNIEICNGADDDCDGQVDEGACPITGPVSTGKSYQMSPAPASNYPDSGGELTNGGTATGESWVHAAGWIHVNPTITLDLGQAYVVTRLELYVGNSFGTGQFGVYRPSQVSVSTSTDGVSFTPVGTLAFSAISAVGTKEQVDRGEVALSANARWIRFSITAGGPWVMVTEAVVMGGPASNPINTPIGSDVVAQPIDTNGGGAPATIMFSDVNQPGTTTLTTTASGPPPPTGFDAGEPARYFEISTTAVHSSPAEVCVNYDGIAFTQSPELFHYEGGAWNNITTTVDAASKSICGLTESFSPFAIFQVGNQPPLAEAGPDQRVECDGSGRAQVTLNGAGSSDPNGDALTYVWSGTFGSLSGGVVALPLPVGQHRVTLTVSDGKAVSTDEVNITVADTQPPVVTRATATPDVLWPPNHRMVPVEVAAVVADTCDPSARCRILSVSSSEPESGVGEGDKAPDWELAGEMNVRLRAERFGAGSGRLYTITLHCTDGSNNTSVTTVSVSVPHDQKQK